MTNDYSSVRTVRSHAREACYGLQLLRMLHYAAGCNVTGIA